MKIASIFLTFAFYCLPLISKGNDSNKTIALVAQNHLTTEAKKALAKLIGKRSIVELCNVNYGKKRENQQKSSDNPYLIYLPLSLNYEDFLIYMGNQVNQNLLILENTYIDSFRNSSTKQDQKVKDLALFISVFCDLNQPLNIGSLENGCGSDIPLTFYNQKTNLHDIWHNRLFKKQGLNYNELAKQVDILTLPQIKPLIGESVRNEAKWLYENYVLSNNLCNEVKPYENIGEKYYQNHISILNERIEIAGIRLAGVLNYILLNDNIKISSSHQDGFYRGFSLDEYKSISTSEAIVNMGQLVKMCGIVSNFAIVENQQFISLKSTDTSRSIWLNVQSDSSNQVSSLTHKIVCAYGRIVNTKGQPEMIISKKRGDGFLKIQ